MQDSHDASNQSDPTDVSKLLGDQSFVSSILASVSIRSILSLPCIASLNESDHFLISEILSLFYHQQLPGVDPNDPSVKDLLASMQNQSEVSLCRMGRGSWHADFVLLCSIMSTYLEF